MRVEVPVLSESERQRICCETFVGSRYMTAGFMMQKLGAKGLEEFNSFAARVAAEEMRERGVSNAMSFALDHATFCSNLWGSRAEVDVEEGGRKAVLNIVECMKLKVALELAKKGLQTNREMHCSNCINGYFRKVAENLGLKIEANLTAKGCRIEVEKA